MEKNIHHLTIFLMKDGLARSRDIVKTDQCEAPVAVPISGFGNGRLYVKRINNIQPRWTSLFAETGLLDLRVDTLGAAFLFEVDGRFFALTFGQSGRFLLHEDAYEDRFGLLATLNSVNEKTFRCIDKRSLDAIESHSRIQSGQETSSEEFGLDIEQDMLKAVVGTPNDSTLGSRMTGTDSLSVSVRMNLGDLPHLLRAYRSKYEEDLSSTKYQWVNNITEVRHSAALIEALGAKLVEAIRQPAPADVWLSIPEIVDWTIVKGFMYAHGKKGIHNDVNLRDFLATINREELSVDLLKQRKVYCADESHHHVFKQWSIFKCLYAELDHEGGKYILNDGKWFLVGRSFVDKTNREFAAIERSPLIFPPYTEGDEGLYNAAIAAEAPAQYALLDSNLVAPGGGRGNVEVCDLLSLNRELIHVKRYGKSSVLSHLFAQGYVSAELLLTDTDFRRRVREKLDRQFAALIPEHRPAERQFTVVYAVISDSPGTGVHLPFFSRVNLNNTARVLRGLGYRVQLLKIGVSPEYAKKTVFPERGRH